MYGPDLRSNSDFAYAVRCVDTNIAAACMTGGTGDPFEITPWYEVPFQDSLADGAYVQVGEGLGRTYQCFTAVYFYQGSSRQYRCSPPSDPIYVP